MIKAKKILGVTLAAAALAATMSMGRCGGIVRCGQSDAHGREFH